MPERPDSSNAAATCDRSGPSRAASRSEPAGASASPLAANAAWISAGVGVAR